MASTSTPNIDAISEGLARSSLGQNAQMIQSRPAVDAIKALLNESMRIRTSDGRIFVGTFVCVDKQLNIVLTNTDEYRIIPADASRGTSEKVNDNGRYVTMVMVPWRLVVKVEARNLHLAKSMGLRGGNSTYSIDEEDMEFT